MGTELEPGVGISLVSLVGDLLFVSGTGTLGGLIGTGILGLSDGPLRLSVVSTGAMSDLATKVAVFPIGFTAGIVWLDGGFAKIAFDTVVGIYAGESFGGIKAALGAFFTTFWSLFLSKKLADATATIAERTFPDVKKSLNELIFPFILKKLRTS